MKTIFTAPLALGLVLGVASCSAPTPTEGGSSMPTDVKANIENSVSSLIGLSASEEFMGAVFELGTNGTKVEGFEAEMKSLDEIVANDESLEEVKKSAKESFAEDKTNLEGEVLGTLSKATPLMLMAYSYSFDDPKIAVQVDPTGFANKDGAWVQTKDGAIGFTDAEGKYLAFTSTADNLSFTTDGKQLTLASLSDSLEKAEKSNTDVMKSVVEASEIASSWFAENFDSLNEKSDFSKMQPEILKGFKPVNKTTIQLTGDSESGFVIKGNSAETGETVTFDVMDSQYVSSLTEAEVAPEKTQARQLFDEYVDAYYSSATEDESYDSLEEVVETLKNNEIVKDASWTIDEKEGSKSPVAVFADKEYRFYDVTAIEKEEPASGTIDENASTEELLGIDVPENNDSKPVG